MIKNENSYGEGGERMYDIIFLDLSMPIMDGFQACTSIKQYYQELMERRNSIILENKDIQMEWLHDLKRLSREYNEMKEPERKLNLQKKFEQFYKKVKFRALDKLECPFIIAYSQFVDADVQLKAT